MLDNLNSTMDTQRRTQGSGSTDTDMVELVQVKTILMGEVGAGKTSLLNVLRFGESCLAPSGPEGRTINIEVHSVELSSDQRLWVYDFGGHETYHFSQQLFLSKDAIYVIIIDIAQYESCDFDTKIRHWYNMVTSRVDAPIICVLASHLDECQTQNEAELRCKDIEEKLKDLEFGELSDIRKQMDHIKNLLSKREGKDYIQVFQAKSLEKPRARLEQHLNNRPKIYRTVNKVSALSMEGIDHFKQFMSKLIRENILSFPNPKVPKGWVELGLQIATQRTEKPWMYFPEFASMAKDYGISGKKETIEALRYLQSLGIILHYNDHRTKSVLDSYVFSSANLLLSIFGLVYNHNYHRDEIKYIWKDKAILKMQQGDFLKLIGSLKHKGLIGEKLLQTFWECLGVKGEVFQSVLSLLDKFDLGYEIPVSRSAYINQDRYFVFPYLLSNKIPTEALVVWPQSNPDEQREYGMQLDIFSKELPLGLFEKILVRSNEFLDYSISWKQGMVAFCNGGIDLVKLEVITDQNQSKNYWTLNTTNNNIWIKNKAETTNRKPKSDHVMLELSTRVQQGREDKAGHVMMLLVAVINRIILHHYPGIVALWYVLCPSCIRNRSQDRTTSVVMFPADNIILSKHEDQVIKCNTCCHDNMTLGHVFPRLPDTTINSNGTNEMRSYLQSHSDKLTRHLVVRPVVRHLLKKGTITVTRAQDVITMETEERKQEAVFRMLLSLDRKQMEDLCYYLERNNATETANVLAASLDPRQERIKQQSPRNVNNNAIETKDSEEQNTANQPRVAGTQMDNNNSLISHSRYVIAHAEPSLESIKASNQGHSEDATKVTARHSGRQEIKADSLDGKKETKHKMNDNLPVRMIDKDIKDDTNSIQDLTLTDDLVKHEDMASPPEKVRWKDGKYIGTDYVKLHVQKFFTRKEVHTRKEGDINVQETRIKESKITEETMKGEEKKEHTVRKEITKEKWEELKTKVIEVAKPSKPKPAMTSTNPVVSVVEMNKEESSSKDPHKKAFSENVTVKETLSRRSQPYKIITEKSTKTITPHMIAHNKPTKSQQDRRNQTTQSQSESILSRSSSSYRPKDQYKDPVQDRKSTGTIVNELGQERKIRKSFSIEKLSSLPSNAKDETNGYTSQQKQPTQKEEVGQKERPREYTEIIESSVKYFQPTTGKNVSKENEQPDSKPESNVKVDDVVLKHKNNKNTVHYKTQYNSASQTKELPTLIKSDTTYKLRDRYSLKNNLKKEPTDRKERANEDQNCKEPIAKGADEINEESVLSSNAWNENANSTDKSQFEQETPMLCTNAGKKGEHHMDKDFRTVDERYETEVRRLLADLRYKKDAAPYHNGSYNQRNARRDIESEINLAKAAEPEPYELATEKVPRNNFKPARQQLSSWNQPLDSSLEDVNGRYQPKLKKYVSERNLTQSPFGLYDYGPASMHLSDVSLPDRQKVGENSRTSNVNKWKVTNLDTSSGSSEVDTGNNPTKISNSVINSDKVHSKYIEKDYMNFDDTYARNYQTDHNDPDFLVTPILDEGRHIKYVQNNLGNIGWFETDLDAGFDHMHQNDNCGLWIETDLDFPEDSSVNEAFNRTFGSDGQRQGKHWKSPDQKKRQTYYKENHRYEGLMNHEGHGDHSLTAEPGIREDDHSGNMYENPESHNGFPGQNKPYLNIHHGLNRNGDYYWQRELYYKEKKQRTNHSDKVRLQEERNREHHHSSDKHVHYEDKSAQAFDRYSLDIGSSSQWSKNERYDKSRSLPLGKREHHRRDQNEHICSSQHGYNTMSNTKKYNKYSRKGDIQNGHLKLREPLASSGNLRSDEWYRQAEFPDEYYDRLHIHERKPDMGINKPNHNKHNRSFEISPDMYYTHTFVSSETSRDLHPETSQNYHATEDELYPYHFGMSEYWERIPIEEKHSPNQQMGHGEYVPNIENVNHQAHQIPGWSHDPSQDDTADGDRVSSHNNSDLGFHELSYTSLPSSEPLLDIPKKMYELQDTQGTKKENMDMGFKQIEVHRTAATHVGFDGKSSKGKGIHRSRDGSISRKRFLEEDTHIYENLRPIDSYWPDKRMEQARKGQTEQKDYEKDMSDHRKLCEKAGESESDLIHSKLHAKSQRSHKHNKRNSTDRTNTQPMEVDNTGGNHYKTKERPLSYGYRPHSEHLEHHRDMIQAYLDEINRNIPETQRKINSKHEGHRQDQTRSPSKQEKASREIDQVRKNIISERKPTIWYKRHTDVEKENLGRHHGYKGKHAYQTFSLPRALRFEDSAQQSARSYKGVSEPYINNADNKGVIVTGKPMGNQTRDKSINAYFLSQV